MSYKIAFTKQFKKDYKLMLKQGRDISLLDDCILKLAVGEELSYQHRDHN
jgi:mRNA interferase YafQ